MKPDYDLCVIGGGINGVGIAREAAGRGLSVLLVEAQGERLLLAGDMEAGAERAWLAATEAPWIDWLQSPHHGSRSSSSEAFIRATAPRGVLISRGRNNSFGHPHAQVVERYRRHGVVMHDTAEQGALRLVLGRLGEVESVRRQRRFWRDAVGG